MLSRTLSDGVIALSCAVIAVCLGYFLARRQKEVRFPAFAWLCWVAFTASLGSTHGFDVLVALGGTSPAEAWVRAAAAIIALATALSVLAIMPLAMTGPTLLGLEEQLGRQRAAVKDYAKTLESDGASEVQLAHLHELLNTLERNGGGAGG